MPKWKLVYDGKVSSVKYETLEKAEEAKANVVKNAAAVGVVINVEIREVKK